MRHYQLYRCDLVNCIDVNDYHCNLVNWFVTNRRKEYCCNLSCRCDWNSNIVTIGTVRSLRLEMSQSCCNRLQFVMMLLGFNKKHVVVAPMLICPTLFYLLKFMNVYLMVLWYVTKTEKNIWWILNRCLKSLDVKDSIGSGKKFFPCCFKWEWNSKDKVEKARK